MNKKFLFIVSLACAFVLIGATSAKAESNDNEANNEVKSVNEARDAGDVGEKLSEQHKKVSDDVVKELKDSAEKDNEIKDEVNAIAEGVATSSEAIREKMDKIETRSSFRTFLFGSDYKNLGALRSELVTSDNHIERLTKALDKTTSSTIKSSLEAQITQLQATKTKAETFVKDNESKFSLFGWFIKLFQ